MCHNSESVTFQGGGPPYDLPQPSPLATASPFKSMPALDSCKERRPREESELCLSMDTLYHGEDTEMEFLDSFLDYDSISIISPDTQHPEVKIKEENEEEEMLDHVIEKGGEEGEPRRRRAGLKERMQWFASRGKVNMRGLSSSGHYKRS